MEIEIFELSNTWGCAHREPGGETIYGWDDLPSNASLWLSTVDGDAVEQIISKGLGKEIASEAGAYGGQKRTVLVDIDNLEMVCKAHFEKHNAAYKQEIRNHCHYCGGPSVEVGFFNEPICRECS